MATDAQFNCAQCDAPFTAAQVEAGEHRRHVAEHRRNRDNNHDKMSQSAVKGTHTPGPWSRNIKPASKYPVVFAGRNTHVAMVDRSGKDEETIEANIRLITAAPDLLDALKQALIALEAAAIDIPSAFKRDVIAVAEAAIRKAEGGDQ